MSRWIQLASAASVTMNPNPNSLGTISPFPGTYIDGQSVSAAWTTQTSKGIFPLPVKEETAQVPLQLHFIPSAGTSATYAITLWRFDRLSGTWSKVANNATNNYQGDCFDKIAAVGTDPMFLQLTSISGGTLQIDINGDLASAQ